ncbi:MAG: N-formylglutamate deformylase [Beijerinckiaceae bacterium]
MNAPTPWLTVRRGQAPLLVSLPHTGTDIPTPYHAPLTSLWQARRDADWWIDTLYDFAAALDATIVHTAISRTVIDVNRDPSGVSLYPGQATTELCPTTNFDGEMLYKNGQIPGDVEIAQRRNDFFNPYHATLQAEIARLGSLHATVVLYDCHSIRSIIPRLFDGLLPEFNIGTNSGAACAPELACEIEALCRASGRETILNGRFKGGYITRAYGQPQNGVHAVQMELACRAYMREPLGPVDESNWPVPYDPDYAVPVRAVLQSILQHCITFAQNAA